MGRSDGTILYPLTGEVETVLSSTWRTANAGNYTWDATVGAEGIRVSSSVPITNMTSMFEGASTFSNSDVAAWDVSTVTNMNSMFKDASKFGSEPGLLYTLNNPNAYGTSQDDWFGRSVATSGTYSIVSAHLEDYAGGFNSGKAYIYNNVTGALVHTLDNPNAYDTSAGDYFGYSVAISNTYAIVGAYLEDDAGGNNSGKAYIFDNATGALVHTLDNPNAYDTSTNDYFGWSVAITDTYAIVGAYAEDDAGGDGSGKAYIYNTVTGALLHTLDNPNAYDTSASDFFGTSVAISDTYAIVSAYFEDDAGGTESGKAYIYNNATGALLHTLDNPNAYGTSTEDNFGYRVAISDTYAIVGVYREDDAGGTTSGKAYIYNNATGALLHTLDNPNAYDTSLNDNFARSVALTDTYAIVGAPNEDDAGGTGSGKTYIYNTVTGALVHTLDNPNAYGTSANDLFGSSVAITDTYAIVGAYYEDDAGGTDSGKAYIFDLTAPASWNISVWDTSSVTDMSSMFQNASVFDQDLSAWVTTSVTNMTSMFDGATAYNNVTGALLHTLDNPNAYGTSASDYFGNSVATANTYSIVGAYYEDDAGGTESGKAYIYNNVTGALVHTLNNPNVYSTSLDDRFGHSVALTDNYVIVGAPWEGDGGGTTSGKAYIYNTVTRALLHTLNNPNAYGTSGNDQFGLSVAISDTYAIVGAWAEDDAGGTLSGKAYIYNTVTGVKLHTLDNPNPYGTSQNDFFGFVLAISDTYAIVGARGEDDAGGTNSGKAYIYNNATGALLHTLDNPNAYDTILNDSFGRSVAITDTYAIVGASGEDDAGGTGSGKAYIFNSVTGALVHTLDNPNAYGTSADDQFGWSVSITDTYAIVGARQEDDAGGTTSGKAYIYNNATGALLHTLDNPNAYGTSVDDNFGWSVSITDTYAIVGAYSEDDAGGTDSGKAYIFNLNDISGWDTGAVSNMTSMFNNAASFDQDISTWDVSLIASEPTNFDNNTLGSWTTAEKPIWGTDGTYTLYPLSNTTNDPTSATWRTNYAPTYVWVDNVGLYTDGPITNAASMFAGNATFNDPDVGLWDVTTMTGGSPNGLSNMFSNCTSFNQDLSAWDTSNIVAMAGMFAGSAFNQDISSWNVSNVTSFLGMFRDATAFNNGGASCTHLVYLR